MNLRESFQYMNFLDTNISKVNMMLYDESNLVTVEQEHLKKAANPNAEDEKITKPKDLRCSPMDLINFLDELMEEKEKVSKAIYEAKSKTEVNLDHAVSINKAKQKQLNTLKRLVILKPSESEGFDYDYMINNEGNQVQYKYKVKQVKTIDYDRNKVRNKYRALSKECEEMSTLIDKIQINTEVDCEPKWRISDTLDDMLGIDLDEK